MKLQITKNKIQLLSAISLFNFDVTFYKFFFQLTAIDAKMTPKFFRIVQTAVPRAVKIKLESHAVVTAGRDANVLRDTLRIIVGNVFPLKSVQVRFS